MAESSDLARIIGGCKAGERESFELLVDRYAQRCYGYFFRLTGSRAVSDDLLGELFVKLVGRIRSFKGGSFEVWLFRIASNVFHDHLRDKQKERKSSVKEKRDCLFSREIELKIEDNRKIRRREEGCPSVLFAFVLF